MSIQVDPLVSAYFSKIGTKGGASRSKAKLAAIAQNAKLGGWPKGRKRGPKKTVTLPLK